MRRYVPGIWSVLGLFLVLVTGSSLEGPAWAWEEPSEVLVLDFIGFLAQGPEHGRAFQETVLPQARLVSIGIHGIIPDAWRKDAGYDVIIRAGSAADYSHSVSQVTSLVTQPQTILAFDVNEHGFPNQLRPKPLVPNKIRHPALVAAQVAEHWLMEHPDGQLILRGHSDGTYAERYVFDYLKDRGLAPAAVILESPRQMYGGWVARAQASPKTLFLSITATADLPRVTIIDRGYAQIPSDHRGKLHNWVNLHVQGWRNPFAAHSVVTAYHQPELQIQRTGISGRSVIEHVPMGTLVRAELTNFQTRRQSEPLELSERLPHLPRLEERNKVFPSDPWDKGGGGGASGIGSTSRRPGGGIDPRAPGSNPRGGISADIQIQRRDFTAQ